MQLLVLLVSFAAVLALAFGRDNAKWLGWRRKEKAGAAELQAWRAANAAKTPAGPAGTREEVDAFAAWRASLALPAVWS